MPPKGSRQVRSNKDATLQTPPADGAPPARPGRRTRAQSLAKPDIAIKQEEFSDEDSHAVKDEVENFKSKNVTKKPSVKKPMVQPSGGGRVLRSGSAAPKSITVADDEGEEANDEELVDDKVEEVKTKIKTKTRPAAKNIKIKQEHDNDDEGHQSSTKLEEVQSAHKKTAAMKDAVKEGQKPSRSFAPKEKSLEVLQNEIEIDYVRPTDHSDDKAQPKTTVVPIKKATKGRGRPKSQRTVASKDEEAEVSKGESIIQKFTSLSLTTRQTRGNSLQVQKDKDALGHVSDCEPEVTIVPNIEGTIIVDATSEDVKQGVGLRGGPRAPKGRGRPRAVKLQSEDHLRHTAKLFKQIQDIAQKGVAGTEIEAYEDVLALIGGLADGGVAYVEERLGNGHPGAAI